MARKKIKKVSVAPIDPITGSIVDTTNIDDKTSNTYSANVIDQKLSNSGTSESVVQEIIKRTLDAAHPIGSYYWSDDPTDPSELFGGTWKRVKDKFLYALGDEGNAGDTGGSETHTLTVNEMPSHTHVQNSHNHTQNAHSHTTISCAGWTAAIWAPTGGSGQAMNINNSITNWNGGNALGTNYVTPTNNATTATNQNTGGNVAHNNMPPYVKAYCWKRIDPNAKTMISFTVNSVSCQAEEGMTWEEWCNSSYNTLGYYTSGNLVYRDGTYLASVTASSVIENGAAYYYSKEK